MVSPTPAAAAAHNSPRLSYAERAKKAQNTKSQDSRQLQRTEEVDRTSTITPIASTSYNLSVPNTPMVSLVTSSVPVHSGPAEPRIPSVTTHTPLPSSSTKVASASSADVVPASNLNGGVNLPNGDSASSVPSATPNPKQTAAPPVNVWKVREEQMAQRARTLPRAEALLANQSSTTTDASSPLMGPSLAAPSPTLTSSTTADTDNRNSAGTASTSINGHLVPSTGYDDPFVVKPGRASSNLSASPSSIQPSLNTSPPAIDDTEIWPEVGQAVFASASNGRLEGRNKESRDDEEKGHERETSHGHGSRKSEKTKWLPMPPENLQFEGPARAQHAKQRSNLDRNHHRTPPGASSTSSAHGSQQRSRTHSVAGRRPTPSHTGSMSQGHSRTGSVQSSPRHASIRGGGKRLQDEAAAPVFGTNRSLLSSGTNSPSTYAQPQPLPAQEFLPGAQPHVNTSTVPGGNPLTLSSIPDNAPESNRHPVYYPSSVPSYGVSPYHSPRPSGSPANNIYALPPMGYSSQPGMPSMPMSGYGTPPYPMYPPYGFPHGQPLMYWHPSGGQLSPLTNPQPSDGVLPPTLVARPPPPNQSDAVAGYRDVGFVLPPPVEYRREVTEERGRRTRELSFGSIVAGLEDTSESPSPAPASPSLVSVPEGAALGLDVSGGQLLTPTNAEPVQAQWKERPKEVDRGFTGFSIGIAPGEPARPRLRSRTRRQLKGATAVSSATRDEHAGAASDDPVTILVDVASKVVSLTDTEKKWEFGTIKVVQGSDEAVVPDVGSAAPNNINALSVVPPNLNPVPANMPVHNFAPATSLYAGVSPFVSHVTIPTGPINVNGMPSPSTYGPRQTLSASEEDWEVRDYGYGFKRDGPAPVYPQATVAPREDLPFRGGRDHQHGEREPHYGRPRRGSYSHGGYGYDRGSDRGSYGGRRGRGLSGGYGGRGYQNRSHPGRGGYLGQNQQRQQVYMPQPQQQAEANGFYIPPMAPLATYIPQGYEYPFAPYPPQTHIHSGSPQGAPLPVPQSNVGFPMDSTRYYLLAQLQYYLSAQNMAQDLYLRQQMDSRGWIPISLIASFNRVRALTLDLQLVTDVLSHSSNVEVQGAYVRMRQWQSFVLPTAEPGRTEDEVTQPQPPASGGEDQPTEGPKIENHIPSQNHDGEDDEEEDVVFVL